MVISKAIKILALPNRLFRFILYHRFHFDKWHISPLLERKYANDIIKYLNKKPSDQRISVIEIGCGLGDVIRNLDYNSRKGYDLESNALRAARFISLISLDKKTTYDWFKFPDSALKDIANTIILVNWIHHIPPVVLREKVVEYFQTNLIAEGEIILDTVKDPSYNFNHSIDFLTAGLDCEVLKIGYDERDREIFAIKKNK